MADLDQIADIEMTVAALQQGIATLPVEQAIALLQNAIAPSSKGATRRDLCHWT